jgi:HSP20 family protein
MTALGDLREGLDRAWDSIQSGWRALVDRAAQAITRFRPGEATAEDDDDARALLRTSPGWGLLAAEVRETGDEVCVRLEIPGLEPDQFDIAVQDDILRVSGEKRVAREEKRGAYHVTERAYGSFERTLRLPVRVDADGAQADYQHGVLTVRLPKHASAVSRQIKVHRG